MHPREVETTLLRVQEEFDWPTRAQEFKVMSIWERSRAGTRFFRVVGVGTEIDVVAKTAPYWTGHDVQNLNKATQDLADVFKPIHIEGADFIDPLGWSPSPPMLVLPYIESEQLSVVVREESSIELVSEYLRRTGAMLAAYHEANQISSDDDRDLAIAEVHALAGRLPGGVRRANRLLEIVGDRTAYLFSDTSPGNVLVTSDSTLVMVDPPTEPLPGMIHRDLGNLLFDLRTKLAGQSITRAPRLERFSELRVAFLDGYYGDSVPYGPADESLIALFEFWRAAGMTRKRLSVRLGDVPWFARLAVGSAFRFLSYFGSDNQAQSKNQTDGQLTQTRK